MPYSKEDHDRIDRLLGAVSGPKARVYHGAVGAGAMASQYLKWRTNQAKPISTDDPVVALKRNVREAFLEARDDDYGLDVYIADPIRNERFLAACARRGLERPPLHLNRLLMNLRKAGEFRDLRSKRLKIEYHDILYASMVAYATVKARTGATVDEVLCDPSLALVFDEEAKSLAPGRDPITYRWALLGARKNPRNARRIDPSQLPELSEHVRLGSKSTFVPSSPAVYLLQAKDATHLYTQAVVRLDEQLELMTSGTLASVLARPHWGFDASELSVYFARLDSPESASSSVTQAAVELFKPRFNLRKAA